MPQGDSLMAIDFTLEELKTLTILSSIVTWNARGDAEVTDLVSNAKRFGLKVHPWTVRAFLSGIAAVD